MRNKVRSEGLLLLCALIWGMAFVAQSVATKYIGPGTFQCIRSILALFVLFPLVLFRKRSGHRESVLQDQKEKSDRKRQSSRYYVIQGGMLCGLVLSAASVLQQEGITYTTAGNAGFLTSIYLILVPVFSVINGKKVNRKLVIAVIIALLGVFIMNGGSQKENSSYGVILLVLCAVLFAVHIMLIDHFVTVCDAIELSCAQFLFSAVFSGIWMILAEDVMIKYVIAAAIPLLYAGIMSSGVAYTLQIIGQKAVEPSMATLLMSFESVFSLIGGILLLHETPNTSEVIGCLLMFLAVRVAQKASEKSVGQRI